MKNVNFTSARGVIDFLQLSWVNFSIFVAVSADETIS